MLAEKKKQMTSKQIGKDPSTVARRCKIRRSQQVKTLDQFAELLGGEDRCAMLHKSEIE